MVENQKFKLKFTKPIKLMIPVLIFAAAVFLFKKDAAVTGLLDIKELQNWIESWGIWAPFMYVMVWIIASIAFFPVIPLKLIAGIIFGPVLGTVYTSIASTLGATFSFLLSRYCIRTTVVKLMETKENFRNIQKGVKANGWKMLIVTRVIPLFPYHLQNYIYGVTKIDLPRYVFVSWVCMLPANIAYCWLGGSLTAEITDLKHSLIYLGPVMFFVVIIVWFYKHYNIYEI